jgi:hypothetical protein
MFLPDIFVTIAVGWLRIHHDKEDVTRDKNLHLVHFCIFLIFRWMCLGFVFVRDTNVCGLDRVYGQRNDAETSDGQRMFRRQTTAGTKMINTVLRDSLVVVPGNCPVWDCCCIGWFT